MASSSLEQDSNTTSDHSAPDVIPPSLLTLPDTVLTQISQHSIKHEGGHLPHSHPLLSASRGCRDMVLSSIRSITLDPSRSDVVSMLGEPPEACDPAPWARLLNRACCQAGPGLAVKLGLSNIHDSLPELLQPGVDCGGWSKVHSLQVRILMKLAASRFL
jgi:hypothetical protein